jgi:predicted transcriptional regulator
VIRDEHVMRSRILKVLESEPRTIPEIAAELGRPSSEVTFWIMGMRKYGYAEEEKEVTDEGYYRYRAVARDEH